MLSTVNRDMSRSLQRNGGAAAMSSPGCSGSAENREQISRPSINSHCDYRAITVRHYGERYTEQHIRRGAALHQSAVISSARNRLKQIRLIANISR